MVRASSPRVQATLCVSCNDPDTVKWFQNKSFKSAQTPCPQMITQDRMQLEPLGSSFLRPIIGNTEYFLLLLKCSGAQTENC